MADIQRWTVVPTTRAMCATADGEYVTYADYVEALAEVRKRNADNMLSEFTNFWQQGYGQGQREALDAAVQRVEAWSDKSTYPREAWATLFAAIKGDQS